APDDRAAAERLVQLYVRARAWSKLPAAYAVLLRDAGARESHDLILAFEPHAIRAGSFDAFALAVDRALERAAESPAGTDRAMQAELLAAKARVLSASPERQDDAAALYRRLVEMSGGDGGDSVKTPEGERAAE